MDALKKTPDERLEELDFLRRALSEAPTPVAVLAPLRDADGRVYDFEWRYANAATKCLLPSVEGAGMRLSAVGSTAEIAPLIAHLARVVDTNESQRDEVFLPHEEQPRWLVSHAAPIGPDIVVTFTDCSTERSLREERARQAAILTSVFEHAPFAVCVIGGEPAVFEFANEEFEKIVGRAGLLGEPLDIALSFGEAFQEIRLAVLRALEERKRVVIPEYHFQGADEARYLHVVAQPLDETSVDALSVQLVAVDVTAFVESRFKAEELAQQLVEEQELYRATFTDAPVGIAHLDLSGRFTEVNQRLVKLFGFSRDEFMKMTFSDLRDPDDASEEITLWDMAEVTSNERSRVERRYLHKDGRRVWTTLTVSAVQDQSGVLKRFIAIVEDITGLAQANERLEESNRSKDEFLAVLGHELRNPLGALRHASMVLSERSTDGELLGVVNVVERQTRHMGRLVDDLLDIGRIAQGKFDFRSEQVDMRRIVNFALDDLEVGPVPPQKLQIDLEEGPLWVSGDSARLLQACQNILSNAVKYTPPDGSIYVRLTSAPSKVVFSVKDDGVGLEESFAQKLFLPFEQAPQDLSRSQGGLGLGLALTSQIVNHHGGSIRAESEGRGHGATFTLELPRTTRPTGLDTPVPPKEPRRRLRFLVIEDNQDAADLLQMLLHARGHEVTLCASGDRAVDAALGQSPDVILCDLGLPGLSGFEVAERIRATGQLTDAIMIALSGYSREEDRRRCQEVGFSSHLTKPVDVNEIFAELDRLAAKRGDP